MAASHLREDFKGGMHDTTLLGRVFAERKRTGGLDLEAVEMAFRAALHDSLLNIRGLSLQAVPQR